MNYKDLHMVDNIHVFLDISIDDIKCGRVIIELFSEHVPKTAENFRALCTGEKGVGGLKVPLHYKNSIFHKAVPECIVQGGDITNHDGTGGESIYGPYFEDENLDISHSEQGILSMANCGMPNTNNSQFCVSLGQLEHLDGSYVVFGRIVKGFQIINDISYQPLDINDRPIPVCKIYDCGELKPGDDWAYRDNVYSDTYPPHPEDWDVDASTLQADEVIKAVTDIKDAGNKLLKDRDLVYAYQKYKKGLRYINWHLMKHINDQEALAEIRSTCHLNAALPAIKLCHYRDAILHCNQVPNISSNVKALFRRAIARVGLNDHMEALADLHTALELVPNDATILRQISHINRFLSTYQQAERMVYARMFQT